MSETTNPVVTRAKEFNEALRVKLAAYRADHNMTNGELAVELGVSGTAVSKYLNGKPEGDVEKLEANIEDVLQAAARRLEAGEITLIETSVTRQVNAALETIRKTNDIGLIHGPAGAGKTCALDLYRLGRPLTIIITATRWSGTSTALERALFTAISTRAWTGNTPRMDFLIQRFKWSNRLLCIDNAQRLTISGLQWIFDFHDETGIPIALIGNPEVLNTISANDQQFSRIGLKVDVRVKDVAGIASALCRKYLKAGSDEDISDLAEKIVGNRGHLRALKKHLLLMPEMGGHNARQAFKQAHTCLVSDVNLA